MARAACPAHTVCMERVKATVADVSGTTHVASVAPRSTVYLNGRATRPSLRRLRTDRRPAAPGEVLPLGAHLLAPRRGYTHHGIHVGGGRVVHYAGLVRSRLRGPVEVVTLDAFADGRALYVKLNVRATYDAETIVARALSRLGENRYRITSNNCEHFCEWCLRGESHSEQVERWLAGPRRILANLGQLVAASLRFAPRLRRARSRATAS